LRHQPNHSPGAAGDFAGSAGRRLSRPSCEDRCPDGRGQGAGLTLVAISYDPPDVLAEFARRGNITFPLLSDSGSRTIDACGIRDPQGNGYPHPQTFLVRADGILGAVLSEEGFMTRHTTDALVEAAGRIK
jgi:peroxiredoxin